MKKLLILYITFLSLNSFSQKQTAHWYFGDKAGINFNTSTPVAINGQLNTNEGCASISDYNGNLLFYTDGENVWNRNQLLMLNGDNLNGDISTTNSAIIVPKPNSNTNYYIFTTDDLGGPNGFQFSEVDMTLDGGFGGVINKNTLIYNNSTEKITATKHANGTDWWVLSHRWNSDEFVAHRISSTGINSTVNSNVGIDVTGSVFNTIGAIKFSPNGKKIAIAHSYGNNIVQLFDFNDSTGIVSNPKTLTSFNGNDSRGVYGLEFSPNGKLLYTSDSEGTIYQFNTELSNENDIMNSRIEIISGIGSLGALQIAMDGKIYVAREFQNHLGIIEFPDLVGTSCNYINDGINLNTGVSKLGLPPFIQSYFFNAFNHDSTCYGQLTNFSLPSPEVSQTWDFDDPASGANNFSNLANPSHLFSAPGIYNVTVRITNALGIETPYTKQVVISESPTAYEPINYIECDDNKDNDNSNGFTQSFLLALMDSQILGSQDPNIYDVLYFEDIDLTNQIDKSIEYENTNAYSQDIYAKVIIKNDNICYDTTHFKLIVNDSPKYDLLSEKVICTNNLPDSLAPENAQGTYTYQWTREDGSVFFNGETLMFNDVTSIPDTGLNLTLTATDLSNNCTNSKNVLIRKVTPAIFTQNDITITDLSENNTVTINPQDPNFITSDYLFALGDATTTGDFQNSLVFENVIPGIKTLYIKDIYGCNSSTLELSVLGFPKYFTPNNDGFNDTWHVLGVNRNFYATSIIKIFDRFGKIITTVSPSSDGWDGFYEGKELPETDYWFTVELINSDGETRNYKGHFSLIRR